MTEARGTCIQPGTKSARASGARPATPPGPIPALFVPLLLGLISLAYFLAQVLAFRFPDSFGLVAAIWPAAGIALASLLLSPRKLWPALLGCLFVAGLAANLTTPRPFMASAGFMLANICETAASAFFITRLCGDRLRFSKLREVLALGAAAILINGGTSLIGAGVARFTLSAPYWIFYRTWWIADGLGLLLITPLIVVWADAWRARESMGWERILEFTVLLAPCYVLAWGIFGQDPMGTFIGHRPYMLFLFVVWAAFRFGPRGTITLLGLISLLTIAYTVAGRGWLPLGAADATMRLLAVQLFLGVLGLAGMMVAAAADERLLAVAEVLKAKGMLAAVVEGTTDAVYVKDLQGRYLMFNAAAARFTGKGAAETLGHDDTFLFPAEEARAVMDLDRRILASGKPYTCEEVVTNAEGQKLTFLATKGPLREENGNIFGLFGIDRDITERKRAESEKEKVTRELIGSKQAMEDFLYITTHDLRAPLVNIHGFSRELARDIKTLQRVMAAAVPNPDTDPKAFKLLSESIPVSLSFISEGAKKMGRMLAALLQVSRLDRQEMSPTTVDMNALVGDIRDTFSYQLAETGGTLKTGDLPPCRGDAGAILHVFSNLIDNAVKYRDPGRKLEISVKGEAQPGGSVLYTVSDNGAGISEADLDKIWNMFYRGGRPGPGGAKGEGVGLYLAKKLVESNGGKAWARSENGRGADFFVELPSPENAR